MTTIKTEWDLSLLYKGIDDPQIEKDVKYAESLHTKFANTYAKNDSYLRDENALLKALQDIEKLSEKPLAKPLIYLSYSQALNSSDTKITAKINLLSQRYSKMGNKLLFFDVKLSKIDKKYQQKFLKSTKLSKYQYLLEKDFESGKHTLTEPEEKIMNLKSLTSREMWGDLTERLVNKILVEYGGEMVPLSKTMSLSLELPKQEERLKLHRKNMSELAKIADVAEAELNAIVTDKKISDELRGYKEPFDATILGYENDRKSVLKLVETVTGSFSISKRFFKVKTKMLGLPHLYYSDRMAEVGVADKKMTFEESYAALQKIFERAHPRYRKILDTMVSNGQVDVYPRSGKHAGAFCSASIALPTFVLLNHIDNLKSHTTFAHEMGHAIHGELSKEQPAIYEHHSTSTAEVASTLFEAFAFYDAFESMTEEQKIVALHDKIQDDVSTIFRQIACFNFEVEMHNAIREKGSLSKDELCAMMNRHMSSYLGDAFKLSPDDGLFFVTWSHLRSMFYVYTYAFGQLASKALYKKYSEDKSYIEKINTFLSLGGSMSPEDIFKSVGIDVRNPGFWKKGIESIEEDIVLLESLVEKSSKKR